MVDFLIGAHLELSSAMHGRDSLIRDDSRRGGGTGTVERLQLLTLLT